MRGKLSLTFCEEGCKINAQKYQDILKKAIPEAKRLHKKNFILQQDSAPSHRARSTQSFIAKNVPSFIPCHKWPPNSPDLNPLDYCVWGALKEIVYTRSFTTLEGLKAVITEEFEAISQTFIDKAIQQWRKRLQMVVKNSGGHIEHLL